MKNILYTADPHFDHVNIIKYTGRPFRDIGEMNSILQHNYKKAEYDHTIVVAGDMSLNLKRFRINHGPVFEDSRRHIFIAGNHDRLRGPSQLGHYQGEFGTIIGTEKTYKTNCFLMEDLLDGVKVKVLISHVPLPDGVLATYAADFNVHGHAHNDIEREPERYPQEYVDWLWTSKKHLNACVELHQYRPVSLKDLYAHQIARLERPIPRGQAPLPAQREQL